MRGQRRDSFYQVPGRSADGLNMFADPWRNRQISDGGEKGKGEDFRQIKCKEWHEELCMFM